VNTVYEFDFSESTIKRTNRLILWLAFIIIPPMFGFGLILTDFKITEALIYCCLAFLILVIPTAMKLPRDNRRQRQMKVRINDERIQKQSHGGQEHLLWGNIVKVKITENVRGAIHCIKLDGNNKKSIRLYGFNQMKKIAELIKKKKSNDVIIQTRRHVLNWERPFALIAVCWGTAIPVGIILILGVKFQDSYFMPIVHQYLIRPLEKFLFELLGL